MKRILFIGLIFLTSSFCYPLRAQQTALDRYIAKPDPNYSYGAYRTDRNFPFYTTYFLRMVSQKWRQPAEVNRRQWEHVIQIIVPAIRHSSSPRTAILLVNGGSNQGDLPTRTDDKAAAIAVGLGSVVVMVGQIPNQPLYFTDEGNVARREDAILAYSFDKFLTTGDEEWPVLLPMTKAVVRTMDTVQTFLADRTSVRIDDFIIEGGSKRGWTTWLTAAVDPRVKAIAPASIDLLNMQQQFRRHFEAYGFYAPAISEYVAFDLPERMASAEGQALLTIVDPYSYRDRYTLPKIILNSTGDQFFLPDSSQLYYAGLPGPKWLRYTPNTDHKQSLDVAASLATWIDQINEGRTPPRYTWSVEPDGAIRVKALDRPDRVRLWQATNPNARDFRLEAIGPVWTATDLPPIDPGVYRGNVPLPPRGWTAYMVELTYEKGILEPNQLFTTDVQITPDTLPFAGDNPITRIGTAFDDVLEGTPAGDTISGLGGNDILRGFGGNDTLNGGPGNDILNGGLGTDIAVYVEERNAFTVLGYAGTIAIGHRPPRGEGLDRLRGIESLRFSDRTLSAAQAHSPLAYIASYGDLIGAFGADEAAGFLHFRQWGYYEGRRVTFDAYQYVASYGDLILAFGVDARAGTRHYIDWGYNEGRSADAFDEVQYVANYPDLKAAFGTDYAAATVHFITHGYFEGRTDKPLK